MTPRQLERLTARLPDVRNTDDLYDLELRFGPFDEEDAVAKRALFQLASARCQLARGPALSPERFTLSYPAPPHARDGFELRGRMDARIVRVGWADGMLFGSAYAIDRIRCDDGCLANAVAARERIVAHLDAVLSEEGMRAVA
jgi:hypothetical protein